MSRQQYLSQEEVLARLLQQVENLNQRLNVIDQKVDAILKGLLRPKATRRQSPDLSLLTPEQQEVFEEIAQVEGTGAKARREVQRRLGRLKDQPFTEPLVQTVNHVLRERGWGLPCHCGRTARLMWRGDGYVQFTHTGDKGRSVSHGGFSNLPQPKIVEYIRYSSRT